MMTPAVTSVMTCFVQLAQSSRTSCRLACGGNLASSDGFQALHKVLPEFAPGMEFSGCPCGRAHLPDESTVVGSPFKPCHELPEIGGADHKTVFGFPNQVGCAAVAGHQCRCTTRQSFENYEAEAISERRQTEQISAAIFISERVLTQS